MTHQDVIAWDLVGTVRALLQLLIETANFLQCVFHRHTRLVGYWHRNRRKN